MDKEEIQLISVAISLVLTPLLSAFVVRHQLKKGHFWWIKQQEFLGIKTKNERRFKVFEDCARLLPTLNKMLLDQQVFMFSKNECEYLLKHCVKPELVNREYISNELERYKNLIFDSNANRRDKFSELLQIAYISKGYYKDSIFKDLNDIYNKMKKAENQIMPLDELTEVMNASLNQGDTIDVARIKKGRVFDQRWEQLDLVSDLTALLDKMHNENQEYLIKESKSTPTML